MPKYLIAFLIVLLPFNIAGAQTSEEADREVLRDAWARYTEAMEIEDDEVALVAARQVFEVSQRLFPEDDKQVAAATLNYGDVLYYTGRLDESAEILEIALRRFEHLHGKQSPELIHVLLSMADASARPPDYRPAQHFLDRAHEIADSSLDPLSIEYATAKLRIADSSFFDPPSNATGEAIEVAYDIYTSQEEPAAMDVGRAAHFLGAYLLQRGEYEDAERYFREALDVLDSSNDDHKELRAEAQDSLMWISENIDKRAAQNPSIDEILEHAGPHSVSENYLPLVRVAPIYPASALREGITGHVDLLFTVDEQGFVINPVVVDYTGSESFQDAALQAVFQFRYVPRVVDGDAVAVQDVKTRITFQIQSSR